MANFRALALLLILGSLLGCSKTDSSLTSGLVYCSEANPELFNPQLVTSSSTLDASSKQIYNRLLGFDDISGQLVPELASRWEISEDGLSYRFTLRQDVWFQSNERFTPSRPLNADDVLFSFLRLIDTDHPYHRINGGQYPFFQSIELADNVRALKRLSDHQVEFQLHQADATFLTNIATDFAVVLSAEYGAQLQRQQRMEEIDYLPIGTGPFRLVKYQKNQYIRYRRHPNYFGEPAGVEQLIYDITPNATSRMIKLIGGDCDVAALPQVGQLSLMQEYNDLQLEAQPGFNVAYWAFNTQKPPFDQLAVRQALAMAVNRQKILQAVYHNTAAHGQGMLPPISWAYQDRGTTQPYNPVLAKTQLQRLGLSNLSFDIWAPPIGRSYNPNAIKTAELIQQDMAAIGVQVRIVSYDWNLFTSRLRQAEHDTVLLGWNADNTDPDNFFTPLLSCSGLVSGTNHARWCNGDFDRLLSEARNNEDRAQRRIQYQQLEQHVLQQVPVLPLAHATRTLGRVRQLQGPILTTVGGIKFAQVKRVE
ncbi:cationic peptide transport system substrate-binding protein [Ferrimonas sediminum]|uniref:Cationic peptide transport system substrate-binding protein n=1 Tax=Ferrimonas sediminum TaxID=718193 RepID=A0A1G9ATH2_9GAMM|nr:ABC transporter substrate-binding protein SapA [Ferrimonas sediminum]SDK30629.1 cationic peptide transport system substrate-binding protein [Ferrimonas sediminum]